jgi:glutamate-5-semialdehyde dehydrogenase
MATTEQKNAVLNAMAEKLAARKQGILSASEADLAEAKSSGVPTNLINRLRFGEEKIDVRIRCLRKIEALPDPVGQTYHVERRPNGLEVARVRVPLGVILMIYEARPHVTVNAGAFCLKSGNAVILRGGSEAKRCNALLGGLWRESLAEADLPPEAIQVVSGSHEDVNNLLQENECIDLVIPRGGKGLIKAVSEKSRIPVIKHFAGICHVYIDQGADVSRGIEIALDSKCLMPEVCNALETLLVCGTLSHQLPEIVAAFRANGVTVKGCDKTRAAVPGIEPATEEDWRTEYLDTIVSVRVVGDVDEAIEHINRYGSHHTDAIVTDSQSCARKFVQQVDSAVVLVNASTMFCDGESLGMGAEIGISTDKLHARGPMGLEELTSYKFVIQGDGHVMGSSVRVRQSS